MLFASKTAMLDIIKKQQILLGKKQIEYVIVQPPNSNELVSYNNTIMQLVENRWFLCFLEGLKKRVMTELETGNLSAEYYKGKMSVISDIFRIASDARDSVIDEVQE
jgi:hypothetical protein